MALSPSPCAATTRRAVASRRARRRCARTRSPSSAGVVFLVGDVLAPGRALALAVHLEQRQVGHEAVGGGAVPVLLARLEEYAVAGADDLDRPAATLAEADALGDVDGLA